MNILIPHSWLKTLLETNEQPRDIGTKLSLSGPSVERIEEKDGDFIYDIEVTTNRPDTFSVWGIAREIYAIFYSLGIPVKLKEPEGVNVSPKLESQELSLSVKIQKEDLAPRFTAIILDSVSIKASPSWMQKRLELSGTRAINAVVDTSNYVMLEMGQPMHTFDFDKIRNSKMTLRESYEAEEIVTLDGQKRKLPAGTIVIEDEKRLIDLCGIMGGENSQIDENTKRVLLFVQTYNPVKIRRTSNALGLRTDASTRFEKGLDTEGVIPALNRAVFLLKTLCGTKVASKLIDIYPHPYKPKTISLSKKKLDSYMGINVQPNKAKEILEGLGFTVKVSSSEVKAEVPSFRAGDIEIEEDLIEEIARIWGYDKLPSLLPLGEGRLQLSGNFYWQERVRDYLKHQGFWEVYSYSMHSQKDLAAAGIDQDEALKIRNPLNYDLEYMQPTLLIPLLKAVAKNQNKAQDLSFFELAKTYSPAHSDGALPQERLRIGAIWQTADFYALKGVLEGLLEDLGIRAKFERKEISGLLPGQTAYISSDGKELGRIGVVDHKITKAFGVAGDVCVFGLDFETLSSLAKLTHGYTPISKYPQVSEDLSMIIDEKQEIERVLEIIGKAGGKLLKKTEIFDIFKDLKIGKNKKSVAVHLFYQSQTHNLSSEEITEVRKKIINALEKELNAKVRLKEP